MLLIVDEFSGVAEQARIARVIETVRSYGAAVVLAPQVAEGMGGPEAAARILGSVGTVVVHRVPDPDELATVRVVALGLPLYLALRAGGTSGSEANTTAAWVAGTVCFAPCVLSVLALLGLPGGAGLTRLRLGARRPSPRERDALDAALAVLPGTVPAPRTVLVIDHPTPQAFVVGSALYLHRGVVWDPALPGVLAHELGHLNALDARLTLAARRLAPVEPLALLLGGLSLALLAPLWAVWERHREFAADAYAAHLGQAHTLAAFLEREQFFDVAVPFLGERTHPYVEQRLARLDAAASASRLPVVD